MTLKMLADKCGVSVSTVSKALSNSNEISEDTKEFIVKEAKKAGCYEKYNKGKYEKKIIAIICPEVSSAYYTVILEHFQKKIEKSNGTMVVSISNFNVKTESELISFYSSFNRANAIIVVDAMSKIKNNLDIPIVAMNSCIDYQDADCVNTDFFSAINEAIFYFKQCGHKKIAYIGETLTDDKRNHFIKAMKYNGLKIRDDYMIIRKDRFEEAGFYAMEKLYSLSDKPTAIFAAYDYLALGAIQNIRKHGENVPENFSIIGIDDISFASHYNISLTTIKSNTHDICDIILDIIYKKLSNRYFRLRQVINVKSELVKRNSVKNLQD